MSDKKQPTSAQHIATVKDGIQNLDKDKVLNGLGDLYWTILYAEDDMPLSPLFDLVTTIRYGREDFLSLEIKNLLALFIHHMAQRVYQWDQDPRSRGVLQKTKEELLTSLVQLADLLNASKEPCVTSIRYIETARQLVATLSMSKEEEKTEFGKLLSTIREMTPFADKVMSFVSSIDAKDLGGAMATHGISLVFNFKTLKLIYGIVAEGSGIVAEGYGMLASLAKGANEQAFVLQLGLVHLWKRIVLSQIEDSEITLKEIKEALENLKEYFEKINAGSGKSEIRKDVGRFINRQLRGNAQEIKKTIKEFRRSIANQALKEIKSIATADDNTKHKELIPALRKIAFHALVDWYTATEDIHIKCEILSFLGEVATLLLNPDWLKVDFLELKDNSLNRLVATTHESQFGPETESDSKLRKHIGALALMALIATVSPNIGIESNYRILGLISDNVQDSEKDVHGSEKSGKWQLQCTAVEALLRFDYFYRTIRKLPKESNTPIADFLEEVGQEYRLVKLFVDRLSLTEDQVDELRVFIAHARKQAELANQRDAVKLQAIEAKKKENPLTEEEKRSIKIFNATQKEITTIGEKLLPNMRNKITKWLMGQLGLDDEECKILLDFLKEDKEPQKNAKPYSDHKVRPILDKLIDKFDLTKPERNLIDKAIFQGQDKTTNQVSWKEWLAEAVRNFFEVDHYPKIACTFNNLDKIKAMIEEEEKLKEQALHTI